MPMLKSVGISSIAASIGWSEPRWKIAASEWLVL
jgi:hypothetical protein